MVLFVPVCNSLSTCLEDNKLIYTEAICAMTLLAKLPPQIEEIV